jgi:hypothetical protein
MPLKIPSLDDRRYQQLVEESLARIPITTPQWTNFNASDPGVTLIQVFAFLTESLIYRANLIPERNRTRFLQLLGVPLQPAAPARGIITISNERGPMETITLSRDLEVRAGQVPFRTQNGLDVLPVEAYVCFKRKLVDQPEAKKAYYRELYASFLGDDSTADPGADVELYELTPLATRGANGVNVTAETVDNALWIALLARPRVSPDEAREKIAGKTLSLGLVPRLETEDARRRLAPVGTEISSSKTVRIEIPNVPAAGKLAAGAKPAYRSIATLAMPAEPAVFEAPLPGVGQLNLWQDIDPLELGADEFPPTLEDTAMNDRVITWLRVVWPDGVASQVAWTGINATLISQRTRVLNELLPSGTGEPDQSVTLSHTPVIASSVTLTVTPPNATPEPWKIIDDLLAAGPEVPAPDLREPPVRVPPPPQPSKVFVLDAESGRISFGDGARGMRPPPGAILRVTYDYGAGRDGNVGDNAVNQAPALPAGLKVYNPVRTWGGTEGEKIAEGEKQITRYLQHRDRLVTTSDFESITKRAPGVDIARVEVLSAYNPTLARQEPGSAPGAVTLMLIPRYSGTRPDAPSPDQPFLASVCAFLDPRRLVTTELFLRGPEYVSIWISAAIEIVPLSADPDSPNSAAVVREAVKRRVREFLAPFQAKGSGWPLRRTVLQLELMAEISRVEGVALVNKVLLAAENGAEVTAVPLKGLQLPRIDGLEVAIGGDPLPLAQLRGVGAGAGGPQVPGKKKSVPVPAIPKEC